MEKREKIIRLAESLRSQNAKRPDLGRFVDIAALQRRLAALMIDVGIKEELHFAGWTLGEAMSKGSERTDMKKAVEMLLLRLEEEKFAKTEITEMNEKEIRFKLRENANCAGLGKLDAKVCYFEAGLATGIISGQTGKRIVCEEEHCAAEGYDACEFVIKML